MNFPLEDRPGLGSVARFPRHVLIWRGVGDFLDPNLTMRGVGAMESLMNTRKLWR